MGKLHEQSDENKEKEIAVDEFAFCQDFNFPTVQSVVKC